jgi:hypothetical protein
MKISNNTRKNDIVREQTARDTNVQVKKMSTDVAQNITSNVHKCPASKNVSHYKNNQISKPNTTEEPRTHHP